MRKASRRLLSSSAATSRVTLTRHPNGVHQVTLDRASKMNALDMDMFRALAKTARDLTTEKAVRAVVVHGDGRAFCAGLDVRSVASPLVAKGNMTELLTRKEGEISNLAQDVAYLWRRVPAPVIAATHGVCLGGGLQIALGCDMRVSAPSCRFSVMEAKCAPTADSSALALPPR